MTRYQWPSDRPTRLEPERQRAGQDGERRAQPEELRRWDRPAPPTTGRPGRAAAPRARAGAPAHARRSPQGDQVQAEQHDKRAASAPVRRRYQSTAVGSISGETSGGKQPRSQTARAPLTKRQAPVKQREAATDFAAQVDPEERDGPPDRRLEQEEEGRLRERLHLAWLAIARARRARPAAAPRSRLGARSRPRAAG